MVYDAIGRHDADWAGLTAPEIRERAAADGSVLVVPVGSIEQHGDHLPVATDTILVDAVAHAAVEATDAPVLLAPPVWSGFSPHHVPFGGTITLDDDTFMDLLEGVADAALENGFDALLFLNGHGGNISFIASATSVVGDAHPEAEVLGLTYFQLADEAVEELRESDTGGMAHGGEFETSLMLHLRPDLVREDHMAGTYMADPYGEWAGEDLIEGGPLSVYRPFPEYTDSGAVGDPALASAEKGAALYERLSGELAELLAAIHEETV